MLKGEGVDGKIEEIAPTPNVVATFYPTLAQDKFWLSSRCATNSLDAEYRGKLQPLASPFSYIERMKLD